MKTIKRINGQLRLDGRYLTYDTKETRALFEGSSDEEFELPDCFTYELKESDGLGKYAKIIRINSFSKPPFTNEIIGKKFEVSHYELINPNTASILLNFRKDGENIKVINAFNPIRFESESGENISICMRDSGFEFNYQDKMYYAKEGYVESFNTSPRGNVLVDQSHKEDSENATGVSNF